MANCYNFSPIWSLGRLFGLVLLEFETTVSLLRRLVVLNAGTVVKGELEMM
jgi:hypothetical protein